MTTSAQPAFHLSVDGPLSLGDLLDRSFRIYRARFGVLVVTAAVMLAPLAIVSGTITGRFMVNYVDFVQGVMVETPNPPQVLLNELFETFGSSALWMMLLSLVGLAANGIVTIASTLHVLAFLRGETLSVMAGFRQALPRLPSLIFLYVVRSLAIFFAVFAVIVVLVLLALLLSIILGGAFFLFADNVGNAENVVAVIGMILLFVCLYFVALILVFAPIILLSARWLGAVPALLAEGRGPIAALSRSWTLTKGNAWRAIGYVTLLTLLSLLVVSLPLGVIQQIMLSTLPFSANAAFAITGAIASVFNIIWYPLYATGVVLLYYDLRVRRESYDLQLRVGRLEADIDNAIP